MRFHTDSLSAESWRTLYDETVARLERLRAALDLVRRAAAQDGGPLSDAVEAIATDALARDLAALRGEK